MSQQSTEFQLISGNEELQNRKRKFNAQSSDEQEFSRTLRSLRHPGSIDWFVLRQFLLIFFGATLLISSFYILMDFLNSADVFVQKCHQNNIAIPVALFQYYFPRLLALFDALLTVCVILPSIVLINQMIKRNETIALACMGIRRVRAAYMIFVAAIVLIVLFAFCREFVLPAQRSIIGCDMNSFFERNKTHFEPKSDPLTSVYISGEGLDLAKGAIIKPKFDMPLMYLSDYGQTITADEAVWQNAILEADAKTSHTVARPAGYLLKNVKANKCLDDQSSLMLNDKPALFTPLTNSWLHKGECFLISSVEIEDFTLSSELLEYSSISELQRIMERMSPNQRTDASIIMHKRITRPFIDFCVIFVGMSFILANDNRLLLILLKAALWWGGTWIIINMTSALASDADQLLSPAMAAWIPLILFSAVAAYVWDKVYY